MDRIMGALENCRVPTIAVDSGRLHRRAAPLLPSCCDLRIGTEDSKFGFPIARTLGNCLSINQSGAARGPDRRIAGEGHDLHRRLIDAKEALANRLSERRSVKDRVALDRHVAGLAAQMASFAPLTLASNEGRRSGE